MNIKELKEFLREEARNIIKESKYSTFKRKTSGQLDEIGSFYLVKKPYEGSMLENIMFQTNILDLQEMLSNGSLLKEDIAGLVFKENRAINRGTSLIKEFDKGLKDTWKNEINELKKKCDFYKNSIDVSKKYYKENLTEDVQNKHTRIEEAIQNIQNKIQGLNERYRSYKKQVKKDTKGGSSKSSSNKTTKGTTKGK